MYVPDGCDILLISTCDLCVEKNLPETWLLGLLGNC